MRKARISVVGLAVVALSMLAAASSHGQALAVLNEPCADSTDTYAWLSDGGHDKLYLIMNFNPLHEPGQGSQGLRACAGYRYEFHIGTGKSLRDRVVYRVKFKNRLTPEAAPSASDKFGGGNEILWQLTGGTETYKVTRIRDGGKATVLAKNRSVVPNNQGPQTDRLVSGLGPFQGYEIGDPMSREVGLYDQAFVDRFISRMNNGGRVIAGPFDDPYQLDEKGLFDLFNLNTNDLDGIPGARRAPGEDVFAGFDVFSIALEIPMSDIFPEGIPHNGQLRPTSTDSLLRIWSRISRRETQRVDPTNNITGLKGSGPYVQVGRNALPLFNAVFVGTQRQTLYLRSTPMTDVKNFGADILFPVLVRDFDALGIYPALGIPGTSVAHLKGPRRDIVKVLNLDRPIPMKNGFTGDVITLDAATDSRFPNGRRLGGGNAPNSNQVNVNTELISLIAVGDPGAGLAKGTEVNDKNYLYRFPFLAPAHQGLYQGHGGVNAPTLTDIPDPDQP
jgi:hypothetical protein